MIGTYSIVVFKWLKFYPINRFAIFPSFVNSVFIFFFFSILKGWFEQLNNSVMFSPISLLLENKFSLSIFNVVLGFQLAPQKIYHPYSDCLCPNSDCLRPNSKCLCPYSDCLRPYSQGLYPYSDCLCPYSVCLCPNSDYLHSKSKCLCPYTDCLHPNSDCLRPYINFLCPYYYCLWPSLTV